MIAYIQVNEEGLPYSAHGAAAARGFELLGHSTRYFRRDQLPSLELSPDTVVVGGVGTIYAALERLGLAEPRPLNLPTVLHPFAGRRIWRTTGREIREFPVFVKPGEFGKLFQGQVVTGPSGLEALMRTRPGFPEVTLDTPLEAQEVVTFVSEWRAFILRRTVVGLSHYAGAPLELPSPSTIRMTVSAYTNAPAGYAADFGLTPDGRTLLVEVNDGYALSHGGLVADQYASLLIARWRELTSKLPDCGVKAPSM